MLKLNQNEINQILTKSDELEKTIFASIEAFIQNDIVQWSPIWYAEALLEFAGFHIYNFDSDEESASDKVWDVIRVGSLNTVSVVCNQSYQRNGAPFFEPHLVDKDMKFFPLGIEYSSSVPYDENRYFFFSKLSEATLGLSERLTMFFSFVFYGTAILKCVVNEELAEVNAMVSTMSGYQEARDGKRLGT